MKRRFIRLQNFFLLRQRNYKIMLTQVNIHLDALNTNKDNPLVLERLQLFEPHAQKYRDLYDDWYNSQGKSFSGTWAFNELAEMIPEKLKYWQRKIMDVYAEESAVFKMMFPNGRQDIYHGRQDQILSKLRSLETDLKSQPSLQTIFAEVEAFNKLLATSHKDKGEKHDGKTKTSTELEAYYYIVAEKLFSDFLILTDIFIKNTNQVLNYFDLNLIYPTKKDEEESGYVLTIPKLGRVVADISFSPDDTLFISNNGGKSIYCYSAATADAPEPAILIEILPGDQLEITALTLGAPANKFLIFVNKDATEDGEVEIVLV